MSVHAPAKPQLPRLESVPGVLTLKRSDVTAYDVNPFSFYINYDLKKMGIVDSLVQEFGGRFTADQNAEEPKDWVMVQHGGRWHRAQILEKFYNEYQECSRSEVSLIDSGHRVLVNVEHIFPIPPEVLAAGPSQSLRIFPNEVDSSVGQIVQLFEEYPQVQFRVTFHQDLSLTSKLKPHMAGVLAEVDVGFEDWIPLKQLFLTNFVEEPPASNGTSQPAPTNEAPTNNGASSSIPVNRCEVDFQGAVPRDVGIQFDVNGRVKFEPLEPTEPKSEKQRQSRADTSEPSEPRRNGSTSTTHPGSSKTDENGYVGLAARSNSEPARERDGASKSLENGAPASSSGAIAKVPQKSRTVPEGSDDDDASSGSDDAYIADEGSMNIRYTAPSGAVPVDLEGEKQGEIMMNRNIANANQVAQRNQRREQLCAKFRKNGQCSAGAFCPHRHAYTDEKSSVANGITSEFWDYPEITLRPKFHCFAVCTHVDERGVIYLALPYGVASIWDVLDCKYELELDFRKITQELSRLYGHDGKKKRGHLDNSVDVAVVWIDESGSGRLKNVQKGWYRAKILAREEKKFRVLLVDHGAILMVDRENLHHLENDLRLPRQAIRCKLDETEFKEEAGNDLEMYNGLKEKLLVAKIYKYLEEDNVHEVVLIEVIDSDRPAIHYGELFETKGIVKWEKINDN